MATGSLPPPVGCSTYYIHTVGAASLGIEKSQNFKMEKREGEKKGGKRERKEKLADKKKQN